MHMSYCFNFSAYMRFFIKVSVKKNVNIKNKLFFLCLSKGKLDWVTYKIYMNPCGVHSLCTRPNVVYTSINFSKMKFTPYKIQVTAVCYPSNMVFTSIDTGLRR